MNPSIVIPSVALASSFISMFLFLKRTDGTEFPLIQSLLISTNSILLIEAIWSGRK